MKSLNYSRLFVMLMAAISVLSSCSTIFDDRDSCPEGCQIRFKYDYNMKFADAFASEVGEVTLFVFDSNNHYVTRYDESGDTLKNENYYMTLNLAPGKYRLISYGGLTGESFKATELQEGVSTPADLQIAMQGIDNGTSDKNLHGLYYGEIGSLDVTGGYQQATVEMMKDTNRIRLILQQQNDDMSESTFDVKIIDDNTLMASDNSIIPSSDITYLPYSVKTAQVGSTGTGFNVFTSELSTARLMDSKNARLLITNKRTGATVIDIPLVDYLKLLISDVSSLSVQEFLDRQDEYALLFVLDTNYRWLQLEITVEGWTVRINNPEL